MSNVAHGRVLVSQNRAESYRGQSSWSVIFFVVSRSSWSLLSVFFVIIRFCGQSIVLVLVVSRRGQSFFVDGVYILWWLCTRIY